MSTFTPPTIEELQAKFEQYHVEGFIAQGGMGAVYLAKQISLDRPVAIKILPQEFGDDKDYRASFETEAKAMAKLNHSNLVGIYDFGEIYGMLYIVMEYVPGRSLFDTANGQQVDEKEAARLIADMCDGLEHAHDAGLLHRDIKPANVLIDDEAKPKIVDFGLAKPMGEGQTEGVVFGTPGYTAPEVISNPDSVDNRSDIFSMGVMLYELLTGQLPATPMIPASRLTQSDPRFDAIINRSIHPNPDMRYKTAGEFSKALHDLLNKFDGTVSPLIAGSALASVAGRVSPALQAGIASPSVARVSSSSGGGKGLMVIMLIALLVGGVALAVYKDKPNGPTKEELAQKKAEEFKAQEKERKQKAAAAKAKAKKERQRKEKERLAAQEKEDIRREKENKERAAAEEKKLEKERKEAERKKKQEMAKLAEEKRKKAEEKAKKAKLSAFDLDDFLEEVLKDIEPKFDKANQRTKNDLAPILDRMERDIKRAVRRHIKGKKGREAMKRVGVYMNNARDSNSFPELPEGIANEAKKKLESIVKDSKKKAEAVFKTDKSEKEKLHKEYLGALKAEQKRMEKLENKDAVDQLKKEIESCKKLEGFLELFE